MHGVGQNAHTVEVYPRPLGFIDLRRTVSHLLFCLRMDRYSCHGSVSFSTWEGGALLVLVLGALEAGVFVALVDFARVVLKS